MLTELFQHHLWANLRLLDACVTLNEEQLASGAPGTYGTIRDTLYHLAQAEERYVSLLTGEEPEQPLWEIGFPGFDLLRERLQRTGEAFRRVAEAGTTDQIVRGLWRGQRRELPEKVVLIQALNHGAEHRTNITTVMARLGIEHPRLDGWAYGEELAGDA